MKKRKMLALLRAFERAHTDWVEIGMHRPEDWPEIENHYLAVRKLVIAALNRPCRKASRVR